MSGVAAVLTSGEGEGGDANLSPNRILLFSVAAIVAMSHEF